MAPDVVSLYEISKRRWITQPFKKMRFAGIRYFYYLRILFSSQAKLLQHYNDCIPTWPRLRIFSRPWRKFSRNVKTDTGINGTISKSRKMVIWVRTGIPQTALNRDLYRNSPEFWGVASKLQILIQWRWPFPKFFLPFYALDLIVHQSFSQRLLEFELQTYYRVENGQRGERHCA